MSSTISSLTPILIPSQLLGLLPFSLDLKFQPKSSPFMFFYSSFASIFCIGVIIYTCIIENPQSLEEIINFVRLLGMRFTFVVIVAEALLRRNQKMYFLNILSEMDEFIENKCSINLHLDKFRNKILKHILILFGFYTSIWIFTIAVSIHLHQDENVWFIFLTIIPSLVSFLFYFQLINFIGLLNDRILVIHQLLDELMLKEKTNDVNVMKNSQILYDYIWKATNSLNDNFGLTFLVNIINDFITITSILYLIFVFTNEAPALTIIRYVIELMPYILNIIFLSHFCDRFVESVSKL